MVITGKLHGTFFQLGWRRALEPSALLFGDGRAYITSKGLAAKEIVLQNTPENASNLYVRAARESNLLSELMAYAEVHGSLEAITFFGEVIGAGVQDLAYGHSANGISLRVFDVYLGPTHEGQFLPHEDVEKLCYILGVSTVPLLGCEPFEPEILEKYARGTTTLGAGHIREGIVIKPAVERYDPRFGRVILKYINEDYLIRKDGTEYN